jgi:hypothetical protein
MIRKLGASGSSTFALCGRPSRAIVLAKDSAFGAVLPANAIPATIGLTHARQLAALASELGITLRRPVRLALRPAEQPEPDLGGVEMTKPALEVPTELRGNAIVHFGAHCRPAATLA